MTEVALTSHSWPTIEGREAIVEWYVQYPSGKLELHNSQMSARISANASPRSRVLFRWVTDLIEG